MEKYFKYQNRIIYYNIFRDTSKTRPVICLLHGYLEAKETWGAFEQDLTANYDVINIDIPGHGKSELLNNNQSFTDISKAIKEVLISESISKCFMAGHSMGGYLTLAFAETFPQMLHGFILVHSSSFADDEKKRKDRDREIILVKAQKKHLIIDINIPRGFADKNLETFKEAVERNKSIAHKTTDAGIIIAIKTMKNRPDRTHVLKENPNNHLILLGTDDNYINFESTIENYNKQGTFNIISIKGVGHNGYIENKSELLKHINHFIKKTIKP